MSFVSLGYTAFNTSYTTVLLTASGISFYVFANCLALVINTDQFIPVANLFLYSFPLFLDIRPHRYHRVSKVEITFDVIMIIIWVVAATQLAAFAKCPSQSVTITTVFDIIDNSTRYCPTLVTTITGGYLSCAFFMIRLVDSIQLEIVEERIGRTVSNTMFARGCWKTGQE